MTTAEAYVTAAYLVFLGVVLLYVVIYSFKIAALERAVAELVGAGATPPSAAADIPEGERAVALR
jgi:hypothetical protein